MYLSFTHVQHVSENASEREPASERERGPARESKSGETNETKQNESGRDRKRERENERQRMCTCVVVCVGGCIFDIPVCLSTECRMSVATHIL